MSQKQDNYINLQEAPLIKPINQELDNIINASSFPFELPLTICPNSKENESSEKEIIPQSNYFKYI